MIGTSVLFALVAPAWATDSPPATVLEHTLDVRLDWGKRLRTTQSWTVRIDDPAACAAGLAAPAGLDGAVDGEALVLEEFLIVPATAQKGDTYTLTATTTEGRGSHSGVFSTAADLPVERAEVKVFAPNNQKLTVWADPKGDPIWSTRGGKSATVTWTDLPPGDPARVVWSSWTDWLDAGAEMERVVDGKMSTKNAMGREIAADLKSSNLPELARRVFQQIAVIPGPPGTWEEAGTAAEIVKRGEATAAERGIVLISLLRAAGYEARPAAFRSVLARGDFPITVPAPAMIRRPLVQARDKAGRVVWIDPANDAVAVPQMPSSLIGATVWVPGDLPTQLLNDTVVDGTVTINTSASVDGKGNVTWQASVDASGTGLEWIRRLLGPLDEKGQEKALKRLANMARPDLERFAVTSSGTKDPTKKMKISVSGHDEAVFERFAAGMRGAVQPVLGPAMAGWLPPKIRVQEFIDIKGPPNLLIVANTRPGPSYDPDAVVDREAERAGPRLRLRVTAERPYDTTTSSRDARASAALEREAKVGVELLLFPPTSGAVVKTLAATDLPEPERVALETLLWFGVENEKKAGKVFKKALKTLTVEDITPHLVAWLDSGDDRPWRVLQSVLDDEDWADRATVLNALDRGGFSRLAFLEGARLSKSPEPDVAALAMLVQLAHQPEEQPDPASDSEGAAAWKNPDELMATALEQAKAAGGAVRDRAQLQNAEYALATGGDAERALNDLPTDTPRAAALHLTQFAKTFPSEKVRERAEKLYAEASGDPVVAGHLSVALSRVQMHEEALAYGLEAARLSHDDPARWVKASDYALKAGRLNLALDAARRASEIAPENRRAAKTLQAVATLAVDEEAEALGRERAGTERVDDWPPPVDSLMGTAPPDALLALLQFHEADVQASPVMLGIRAQLRTEAGLFDEAARDSINLSRLHGDPDGPALAFAATAGRVFGTGSTGLLAQANSEVGKLTRMEYQLVTGAGDPRREARQLADEPRAEDVLLTSGNPTEASAKVEGWPTDLSNVRLKPPRGYRVNAILSAPKGVTGFSHADRQLAILHVNGATDVLPAPIALLYTPRESLISDADGIALMRLDGGNLPLYAARRSGDDHTVYGLGFTPEAARRALADMP